MLNAKRFKEEINKHNNEFGLTDNSIVDCIALDCRNCRFSRLNNSDDEIIMCSTRKVKWLLSEYREPVKLTKLEYELLKFLNDKGFKYIARDSGGMVFIYHEKPSKKDEVWRSIYGHRILDDFEDLFQLVKWEDEEPTSIEYVLKNCKVVENESE